jgi:hypothetical protein
MLQAAVNEVPPPQKFKETNYYSLQGNIRVLILSTAGKTYPIKTAHINKD